jgi:hypothetical protein
VVAPYPCELRDAEARGGGSQPVVDVERWAPDAWGIAKLVFTARAPGVARFACSGMTYVVDVRAPKALLLEAPTSAPAARRFAVQLSARDARGERLDVGRYAEVDWAFSGAVRADSGGGCEFPPWCGNPPPGASWAMGTGPGTGHVRATFGGLAATADIAVLTPPDAASE